MNDLNIISGAIVDAAFKIHYKLGPGLLESVYHTILVRHLIERGFAVESNKAVSFAFEDLWFEDAFRADLLVERSVVVEIKSVVAIAAVHEKQLMTYMRLLECKLGLLLNFGAPYMRDGIKRLVNGL